MLENIFAIVDFSAFVCDLIPFAITIYYYTRKYFFILVWRKSNKNNLPLPGKAIGSSLIICKDFDELIAANQKYFKLIMESKALKIYNVLQRNFFHFTT